MVNKSSKVYSACSENFWPINPDSTVPSVVSPAVAIDGGMHMIMSVILPFSTVRVILTSPDPPRSFRSPLGISNDFVMSNFGVFPKHQSHPEYWSLMAFRPATM